LGDVVFVGDGLRQQRMRKMLTRRGPIIKHKA